MTLTPAHESAVAAAFAAALPTAGVTITRAAQPSGDNGDAVVVSYVGESSGRLAVRILDPETLVDGLADAALPDRLRSALEAAAGALGAGTLGEATVQDASSVFADPLGQVFDLQDESGRPIGRLAVRITRAPAASAGQPSRLLHRIAGVEMDLTVEVGRTRMAVRDVLDLEPGRIVELDRSAGAPADVKLNGRIIAHGEIVVVDQDYAVRITRILENAEA
ncbi:flagellar motor switch protein FliN [Microbacterium sp. CIAB417]|uniref:flagellar motor switch protein FliN n=1 Tax=Microbacterium sp. CIAB417 TaxID=2860287 RepID=UPI001FABBFBB|nr:flagellar motor switch protein FliN [Microbacterium sp. CIAB417]